MGKNERQAYLKDIRSRHRRTSKKAKAAILDEFCAICGYHRKYAIPLWLPFYGIAYEPLTTETQNKLLSISAATIDRLLNPVRLKYRRKGLGGTKPGSLLKNQIPIRTHYWDVSQPGFMEADTVAHCGIAWPATLSGR